MVTVAKAIARSSRVSGRAITAKSCTLNPRQKGELLFLMEPGDRYTCRSHNEENGLFESFYRIKNDTTNLVVLA
jgi:hypothetical protein